MWTALISVAILVVVAFPAKADRSATDLERSNLASAVAAQGCTGGEMEWDDDDQEFEVDDARCEDGREYDLEFQSDDFRF